MNDLYEIPSRGKFGTIARKLNDNFYLVRVAIGGIEYSTRKNKGMFSTIAALIAAIPDPVVGDWALVGNEFPAALYVCTTDGTWTDSGEEYVGDNVSFNDYVLKSNYDLFKDATNNELVALHDENDLQPDIDYGEYDFDIRDDNGYIIVAFENGHIKTKNFDSANTPIEREGSHDFSIEDERGNSIVEFSRGHIRTRNFDSKNVSRKIRILFFGNSLAFDSCSYVPPMLEEAIGADVTFGILFKGGCMMEEHYHYITEDNPYPSYTLYKSENGRWEDDVVRPKPSTVLASEPWDIIILQHYIESQQYYSTSIQPYLNDILDYLSTHVGRNVKFGWSLIHARTSNYPAETVIEDTDAVEKTIIASSKSLLDETNIDFVIPWGVAVQNARHTILSQYPTDPRYGVGCLCYDSTHLSEGIPCLVAACTVALKLLSIYGYGEKGIIGNPIRPTSEWLESISVKQQNGYPEDITDENCALAQICATWAVKNPWKIQGATYDDEDEDEEVIPHLYDTIGQNTDGAMTQQATTKSLRGKADMLECDEDGVFFADMSGKVFLKYDTDGLDVNKLSSHFKSLVGNSGSSTNSPINDIDEDVVSLITDNLGNSAMLWSNAYGFNVNKIAYDTLRRIREGYVKNMKEWQSLGVGMFIHWGVYSVLKGHYTGYDIDGEYVDSDVSYNAEWVYRFKKIPDNTYKAYQSQFTASNWNAELVVRMAYDCGMKYIIITAKHHEGFVLYNSEYADWDISTSGANGKDLLMSLKNACDKYGLKFCLYFSQVRDWHSEGGFNQEWKNNGTDPYNETEHLSYIATTINTLKEMINKYNPYVLWYDGPDASDEYANLILAAQLADFPQVITNWRLKSDYSVGDFATGEDDYFHGDRTLWPYAENCYTLNGSWGYWEAKDSAQYMCSLAKLIGSFVLESKARTQNALINIGPKADGSIPQLIQNLFADFAEYTHNYGSFEGTEGVNIYSFPNWGRVLKKGNTLRLYVLDGSTSVRLDGVLTSRITGVKVYGSNNGNYTINSDFSVTITGIPVNSDYTPSLVEIYTDSKIVSEEYSNIIDNTHLYLNALAFNAKGAKLQGFDDRSFQFGSWTSSSYWIETTFKYMGTTGQFYIVGTFPSASSNSLSVSVVLTSGNSTQTVAISKGTPTSSSKVTLTNGKTYKVRLSHGGGAWANFSRITFNT